MKPIFVISIIFVLLLQSVSAQEWSLVYAPRYRQLKSVKIHNPEMFSLVGGWPQNDSITFMAFTENSGESWDGFYDIYPGKILNSAIYYPDGKALAAGVRMSLFKSLNNGKTWQETSFNLDYNGNVNNLIRVDDNICYATGGYNGENGFVLKSTNRGETWSVLYENPEIELISACALQNGSLFLSTSNGELMKSINQGQDWDTINIPETQSDVKFYGIKFYDNELGLCVGGRSGTDSIAVILKTANAGQTWHIVKSEVNPCLNSIDFIDENTWVAVGDYGIVLKSTNIGESWELWDIEENPDFHLFYVDFINIHLGAIVGNYGTVLFYNDGIIGQPQISTLEAKNITSSSAELRAMINPAFNESEVFFDYGSSSNLDNTVSKGLFSEGGNEIISETITDIQPNTLYAYRIRLVANNITYCGDTLYFYSGNPIPNWDFEYWTLNYADCLEDWYILGNVQKDYYEEEVIVKMLPLNNTQIDANVSGILNAMIDNNEDNNNSNEFDFNYSGGSPITQKPDTISCRMNYFIEENDSALLLCTLKRDGLVLSEDLFWITGNSSGNFVDTSFVINETNGIVPDTLIIGFVTSNPFNEDTLFNSYIYLSKIWFSPNIEISNQSFETWNQFEYESLNNWTNEHESECVFYNNSPVAFRNEDAYHNQNALCLQAGRIEEIHMDYDAQISVCPRDSSFSVNCKHENLELYYKYFPENYDTAKIVIIMYYDDSIIGSGFQEITDTVTSWQKLIIPINYNQTVNIPNGANIFITASTNRNGESSLFCVDKLCFDGDFIPVHTPVQQHCRVYPNPASSNIVINLQEAESALAYIFDMQGKIQKFTLIKRGENFINIESLNQGVYIIKIMNEKIPVQYFKIIKS